MRLGVCVPALPKVRRARLVSLYGRTNAAREKHARAVPSGVASALCTHQSVTHCLTTGGRPSWARALSSSSLRQGAYGIRLSQEVEEALATGKPVVALGEPGPSALYVQCAVMCKTHRCMRLTVLTVLHV